VWLWGLPPPGPLTFACHWPSEQIPPSQAELDAGLVLAAAAGPRPCGLTRPRRRELLYDAGLGAAIGLPDPGLAATT
jgi:hypothetical protein